MEKVIIYVTPICPYCVQAEALFNKLKVPYDLIDISTNVELRQEMVSRAGGRTSVPQIFIGEVHIGGFEDLYALYQSHDLEKYLKR